MNYKYDLTTGKIASKLTKMSLPIMLTSFIQMAYQLTDMIWVGRLGSGAIAAIGSAGFFTWLAMAVAFLPKIGVEVCVAQSAGKDDDHALRKYITNGIGLAFLLSLAYALIIFTFSPGLINFFNLGTNLNNYNPTANAITYLRIVSIGMIYSLMNPTFSGIYNGLGKTKKPFYFNAIGLGCNMILDPLLIYGVGPFPEMGVAGAAIATIISQFIVVVLFIYNLRQNFDFLKKIKNSFNFEKQYTSEIVRIGFPPSIQSGLFACISIVIAKIISKEGAVAIAVQRIGSQIEALSWMTAGGFSTALSAFVGQNFGAGLIKRVWKGYQTAFTIMFCIGMFVTLLLYFFPGLLFRIFVNETQTIEMGIVYLRILAFSQLFMCVEILTQGAFNGMGNSTPPSVVGILFNFLRIPGAIILLSIMGLTGIWWTISGSSILKGIILVLWFKTYYKNNYLNSGFSVKIKKNYR